VLSSLFLCASVFLPFFILLSPDKGPRGAVSLCGKLLNLRNQSLKKGAPLLEVFELVVAGAAG